jgi:hypothetical protein
MNVPSGTLVAALCAALALGSAPATAGEFTFDAAEFEKKPVELFGYFEQKEEALKLRSNSPAYQLAYPGQSGESGRSGLLRSTSTLELGGRLNLDSVVADLRTQSVYSYDPIMLGSDSNKVMDGGVRWSAGPDLTLDVGKRVQRWGNGYAWNPVGFVERPKDPNDPQASREGFFMAGGEWTTASLGEAGGPISTMTFTGLVLPTNAHMNADYGAKADLNPAAKLYLLALDTDIDVMWRGKGARPQSFGFDLSRNLSSALEIHGEWARTLDAPRLSLGADGLTTSERMNFNSYLLGLRYLTQGEVTWIGEYYRNGAGYSADQLDTYYQYLDYALGTSAAPALESRARALAQAGYGKPSPGLDYLYVKASVSEPFNWVYGAASLTVMSNLNDGSYQITPEISYTGFTNVELRARVIVLGGPPQSEFTEKASSSRLEVYARFFF